MRRFSVNYMAALFLLDGAVLQLSLWLALGEPHARLYPELGFWVCLFWCTAFLILDVYSTGRTMRWMQEYQRIFLGLLVGNLMLAGTLFLLNSDLPREVFLRHVLFATLLLYAYRSVLRAWHRFQRMRGAPRARPNQVLVAGGGALGVNFAREFRNASGPDTVIAGFLDDEVPVGAHPVDGCPVLGTLAQARAIATERKVGEVVIALPRGAYRRVAQLVAELAGLPVRLHVVPDYFDLAFFSFSVDNLEGIPVIGLRDPAIDGFQRLVKRVVDLLLGICMLILSLPLLLVVAIGIWTQDRGPVFYRTERVGENQTVFRMLKFRSMVMGASALQDEVNRYDADGNLIHKRVDDFRVTPLGRWMRKHSVDELPNLWNVLRGEMSLVGPRPELPWLVAQYEPWQLKRFAVPQGMTGWWQVTGRSDKPMHLHTDDDIYYIQNYSLWLDLQIMWRTIAVVIFGKGAY